MTAPKRPFWSVRGPVTLGFATLALLVGGGLAVLLLALRLIERRRPC